ncbi:hypothetical protein Goshw_014257, partial [Gossypium schwendimanii]|nr:hypothetical protein [Gossypium schwendimanii]
GDQVQSYENVSTAAIDRPRCDPADTKADRIALNVATEDELLMLNLKIRVKQCKPVWASTVLTVNHPHVIHDRSTEVHYFSKHDTIKLASHNYLLWKHQLLLILEGYGLEGYVLDFIVHRKQDKFLASWLLSTITDDILAHLTTAKTSCDLWNAIERRISAKSNIKILSMRYALYSLKKSSLSVKEYMSKVKQLSDDLTAAGSFISEQEQVSVILAGLSVEFDSIRVLATATLLSLDLLSELLLDCEARQLELLKDTPCQANLATHQRNNNDTGKQSADSARYSQDSKQNDRG